MWFPPCTSVPTTAPVSWKQKPQNVLEPYFELSVVCTEVFFYELVHSKLFFMCGTFSSQESTWSPFWLPHCFFLHKKKEHHEEKKRNLFIFVCFACHFKTITGLKKQKNNSPVILLASKEKHQLCVNNNWNKIRLCAYYLELKPQTNAVTENALKSSLVFLLICCYVEKSILYISLSNIKSHWEDSCLMIQWPHWVLLIMLTSVSCLSCSSLPALTCTFQFHV